MEAALAGSVNIEDVVATELRLKSRSCWISGSRGYDM